MTKGDIVSLISVMIGLTGIIVSVIVALGSKSQSKRAARKAQSRTATSKTDLLLMTSIMISLTTLIVVVILNSPS
jgi:uncharacterized membrane protein